MNFPEAEGDAANGVYGPVRVSTCHLVTPTPTDVRSMERGAEASLFLDTLSWCWYRNSVLGGDMSWDDDLDGGRSRLTTGSTGGSMPGARCGQCPGPKEETPAGVRRGGEPDAEGCWIISRLTHLARVLWGLVGPFAP